MDDNYFDELTESVMQGASIMDDLEAEYDELVRLREENAQLISGIRLVMDLLKTESPATAWFYLNDLLRELKHD